VVGAATWGIARYKAQQRISAFKTAEATRRDRVVTVQTTGVVEPERKVSIRPRVSAELKRLAVREGSELSRGQEVALLDATEFAIRVRAAEAALEQARANERDARAREAAAAAGQRGAVAALAAAREQLNQARFTAAQAGNPGDAPSEVEIARIALEGDRLRLQRCQEILKDTKFLVGKNAESRERQRQDEMAVLAAEADVRKSEQALKEAEREQQRKTAQVAERANDVKRAGAGLDAAAAEVTRARQAVDAAQAVVLQAKSAVEAAQVEAGYCRIVSPLAGVVTFIGAEEGEVVMSESGNQTGTVIAIISDLRRMICKAQVDETDIGNVSVGQKARLTLGTGGKAYDGRVLNIAKQTTGERALAAFEVKIEVANADLSLRPGMTLNVDVLVSQRARVLTVPHEAIYSEGGAPMVRVLHGTKVEPRQVKLGEEFPDATEVTEGLHEGDRVLIGPAPAE
jgi:RND family efflux transporter MFP subunit